jgi:hypothetical protein
MSMKNSIDTIGNQTRDLPPCSAAPQPSAPPRAPTKPLIGLKSNLVLVVQKKLLNIFNFGS